MKLLTNFDVNLTSFLGVMNVWNAEFVPLPGDEVRLTSKFVISKIIGFFLKWGTECPIETRPV